ncbi:MAG: hypothetical protein HN742_08010 [Lentisphaerae bacterium]|nr:hypothetical protein [Lentisphaerota bacterium]MBT4817011.1 hypothetical protein [Lentisphaerota bacterium]MBT5604713.1 hypothetical protein [Lentisphaerota bacterium]MBT7058113.1 hypothetical protein [Lentisphaerota bacterium]MBT7841801.1 hypothetical protein [Lentisphaerota bacterium]
MLGCWDAEAVRQWTPRFATDFLAVDSSIPQPKGEAMRQAVLQTAATRQFQHLSILDIRMNDPG